MRSSSVKTLVATLLVAVTVTFAVPVANARPTRPTQAQDTATAQRTEPRGIDRLGRAVRQLLNRLAGGITTTNWPSIPPAPLSNQ